MPPLKEARAAPSYDFNGAARQNLPAGAPGGRAGGSGRGGVVVLPGPGRRVGFAGRRFFARPLAGVPGEPPVARGCGSALAGADFNRTAEAMTGSQGGSVRARQSASPRGSRQQDGFATVADARHTRRFRYEPSLRADGSGDDLR
jgi:hypothetical protein